MIKRNKRARKGGVPMKYKIIISGDTGQRILFTGKVFNKAAELSGYHTVWLPLQVSQMRGETATCGLMISKEPLTCAEPENADILIAMDRLSLRRFENTVDGLIVTDDRFTDAHSSMHIIPVNTSNCNPGTEYEGLKNMLMLGALLAESDIFPDSAVTEALETYTDGTRLSHASKAVEAGRRSTFSRRHSKDSLQVNYC